MSAVASTDRRVKRTRRALGEALIALMTERGWDEIGVQDICDRADVGRSTFYMHFTAKEALLASGFGDLRQELRSRRPAAGSKDGRAAPLHFARGMIEHVHENQRLFRAVVGKRSGYVVQRHFRELVIGLVEEDLAGYAAPGWRREAAAHCLAGALVELLTWWLQGRRAQQPEDLEGLLERFTTPVLAHLRATR